MKRENMMERGLLKCYGKVENKEVLPALSEARCGSQRIEEVLIQWETLAIKLIC